MWGLYHHPWILWFFFPGVSRYIYISISYPEGRGWPGKAQICGFDHGFRLLSSTSFFCPDIMLIGCKLLRTKRGPLLIRRDCRLDWVWTKVVLIEAEKQLGDWGDPTITNYLYKQDESCYKESFVVSSHWVKSVLFLKKNARCRSLGSVLPNCWWHNRFFDPFVSTGLSSWEFFGICFSLWCRTCWLSSGALGPSLLVLCIREIVIVIGSRSMFCMWLIQLFGVKTYDHERRTRI